MDKPYKSLTSRLIKIVLILALIACVLSAVIIVVLSTLRVSFFAIAGDSMNPTLEHRDSVVLKQSSVMKRDELVFFKKPGTWTYNDTDTHIDAIVVKRMAAIGGDTLTFDGEAFSVNGEPFYYLAKDNYNCAKAPTVPFKKKLKEGELFVVGDNPLRSLDSRRVFCDGSSDYLITNASVIDFGVVAFKF